MILTSCPSCGSEIQIAAATELGQPVRCPACDSGLEIVWLFPPELGWPEDWQAPPAAQIQGQAADPSMGSGDSGDQ